jgi:hypothetical protein
MPKWCKCKLNVSFSSNETYDKWKSIFVGDRFEMNEFFVRVEIANGVLLKNKSWGTRWEVCKDSFESNNEDLSFQFIYNSVWTPNIPVLKSVYKKLKSDDGFVEVRCSFHEGFSNYRGLFLNGEVDVIGIDSFYKLVIQQDSKYSKDIYSVKKTKSNDLFLYKETYVASYPVDKSKSKEKISSKLDGEEEYIEHKCYLIDLEDYIPIIEYKNKFYF